MIRSGLKFVANPYFCGPLQNLIGAFEANEMIRRRIADFVTAWEEILPLIGYIT
jgi:hypothetical protein